jgi:hypothetical protein
VTGLTREFLELRAAKASDGELRLWTLDSRRLVKQVARREIRKREKA